MARDEPLSCDSAIFLFDLYSLQIRTQAERVMAGFHDTPFETREVSKERLADIGLFVGALGRFASVLERFSEGRGRDRPVVVVHRELLTAIPNLRDIRNATERAEDWLRGAGRGQGRDDRRLTHFQFLLGRELDDLVMSFELEAEAQKLFSIRGAAEAAIGAIEALHGRRSTLEPPSGTP